MSGRQKVVWHPDGCEATIVTETPQGILTTRLVWPDAATAQRNIEAAKATAQKTVLTEPGETRDVRRIPTRLGTLYLCRLGGPPTWYLPRVGGKRKPGYVEVMMGWWRTALVIGFDKHTPEDDR